MIGILLGIYAVFHLTVGGFGYQKIQSQAKPTCKYRGSCCDAFCGHSVFAFLYVFIWPVLLPIIFGSSLASDRPSRVERRREKELTEARHQTMLAEERARENAALDRELARYK